MSTLLVEHGLLDEVRLSIHRLFVGKGSTDDVLFPKGPPTQFVLTSNGSDSSPARLPPHPRT